MLDIQISQNGMFIILNSKTTLSEYQQGSCVRDI